MFVSGFDHPRSIIAKLEQLVRPTATGIQGLKEYKRTRQVHSSSPPTTVTNLHKPQRLEGVEFDDDIIQVSCGSLHSLILTAKGSVYSWGSNIHGQLGHRQVQEMLNPTKVDGLEDQKIVGISAGDEFSIVVDNKSHPWSWGRGEHGQLGFLESRGLRGSGDTMKQTVFVPKLIECLSELSDHSSHREDSPTPLLDIDLEWNLPDFATVGSPQISYGRKALDMALTDLHGYYRTSAIIWWCQDWNDWRSMATIYNEEKQWPQALRCSLRDLTAQEPPQNIDKRIIIDLFQTYQRKLLADKPNFHTHAYVNKMVQLLKALIDHWEEHNLSVVELEKVLDVEISTLSFPLSIIIRDYKRFSFKFHMKVANNVVDHIMRGTANPEEILSRQPESKTKKDNTPPEDGLSSDARLWTQIMRNLGKDVFKTSVIPITSSSLGNSIPTSSTVWENSGDILAFSCGHAFPASDFESRVLTEFKERVQEFPTPLPQTVLRLHSCYKKLTSYPLACPYCVFQHLRQLQLQESPDTPIKPWNL